MEVPLDAVPTGAEEDLEYTADDIPTGMTAADAVEEMCLSVGDIYGVIGPQNYEPRQVVAVDDGTLTVTDPQPGEDETWEVDALALYPGWRSCDMVALKMSFDLAPPEDLDSPDLADEEVA